MPNATAATNLARHSGWSPRFAATRHDLAVSREPVAENSEQILNDALRQLTSIRSDVAGIVTELDEATPVELHTRLAKLGNDVGKLRDRVSALRAAIHAEVA